ncbi:hypothetical protein SAMN05421882_10724 [Nitrosomonas communis]|uniref:Uncharacterized protein n=1 Tax=Nitrosomonas communis TaxID=44574 RepID=A0A1H2ZET7_9PROT|nr:hypothetical protein SAMN05421882_10724 [Nitrosomonas communis]
MIIKLLGDGLPLDETMQSSLAIITIKIVVKHTTYSSPIMIPAFHGFIVSANDKYKPTSRKIMITFTAITAITANPSKNIINANLIVEPSLILHIAQR